MKTGGNKQGVNVRAVAGATAGGAIVLAVAAQILAKPNTPAVVGATKRAPSTSAAPVAETPGMPARLAVAGDPPIRELFRPLVAPKSARGGSASPAVNAPTLPPASGATGSGDTTSSTPAESPTPSGPSASDIQMLGVVELDGTTQALLKRTSSGESRYFATGEDAFGFKVGEIKADEVTLTLGNRTERISMSSEVVVESGASSSAGSSGFGGSSRFGGFGGFGGDRSGGRDRGDRGDRGDRRDRGDRERRRDGGESSSGSNGGSSSGSEGGFTTQQIFKLRTWAERLKALEDAKPQMKPAEYEQLKTFMTKKVAEEKSGK